jgi:hypothetical protein
METSYSNSFHLIETTTLRTNETLPYPTEWDRIDGGMKAVFIESSEFTEWVKEHLTDDLYSSLQQELMADAEKGDVIKGCGGLRKVRVADPKRKKGKRSGARIIYLHVPEARWFYMLDIYGKDEKEDLSNDEKKFLSELCDELRIEAVASLQKQKQTGKKGKKS